VSGHSKWSDIKRQRGVSGGWHPVAGDDQVRHWFTDTVKPPWWLPAKCGKGPAVGKSDSDSRLGYCDVCMPVEPEDLEDVEGIHV
jgi:hypothetical protein